MGGAHYTWQILNKNKEGGGFSSKNYKKARLWTNIV